MSSRGISAQDWATRLVQALPANTRLVASAVAGDRRALERLASFQAAAETVQHHGVACLLARRAEEAGVSGPQLGSWKRHRQKVEEANARAAAAVTGLGRALSSSGLPWALVGPTAVWSQVAEAPADSEIDLLQVTVAPKDMQGIRQLLMQVGWSPEYEGEGYEEFLAESGFVWPARLAGGLRLELYFRPWPWAPSRYQRELIQRSALDASLGRGGYRGSLLDATILASVGFWTGRRPRPLAALWFMHRILEVAGRATVREVYREARRNGLHLPVGLSAALASGLWAGDGSQQVRELLSELSPWERFVGLMLRGMGPERAVVRGLYAARKLSGRDLAGGWDFVGRALWAHWGLVRDETPANWPRPLRRGRHLASRCVGVLLGDLDPFRI